MTAKAIRATAAILGLVGGATGCAPQGATPGPSPSPAVCAPHAVSPQAGCLAEGFRLSGELSGVVADAFVETRCPVPVLGDGLSPTTMDFRLRGYTYRLTLDPGSATFLELPLTISESGTSTLARLEITDGGAANLNTWESTGGTIGLDASGTGGTLGLQLLAQNTRGNRPLHIDGAWHCGGQTTSLTPTPSACATLLSAVHPEGADLTALGAAPCQPLSLDFSGALVGHADRAAMIASAPDLQNGCNRAAQGLHTQFDLALAGRIATVTVWLRREPIRGDLSAGDYPDPGYLDGIDPAPITVSAGRLRWAYKSGRISLAPDLSSGNLDVELQGGLSGFGDAVHVSGSWRCA